MTAAAARAPRKPAKPAAAPMTNAPSGPQPEGLQDPPLATPARTIHMIGHAHIDPVWLWPWQEGYQEARATFRSAIDRMDEYDDFYFTCDQVQLLAWTEEQDPELFQAIQRRAAEGRWVNATGWWVEPDCNIPSGEGLARQGLLGQRYLADRFGETATAGLNADPFGHNAMLPQILRLHGLDCYAFLRPGPHESAMPHSVFWWESPDGSRILAFRIPFEYCAPPGSLVGQTEKALGMLDRSFADLMVFYGVGNHGGGPTRANIDSIHRFATMGSFGRLKLSDLRTFADSFKAGLGEAGLAALPVWRGDLQTHAAGCFSAHSGIKAWVRRAQWAALNAERWAVVACSLAGTPYPHDSLQEAWRQISFNHFHDILPGSAVEPSYDDARDQLGEAVARSKRITTWAHNQIARRVAIPAEPDSQPVVVFNPHPWPVTAAVELQYGARPSGVHVLGPEGEAVLSQRTQSTATTDDKGRGAIVFQADLPPLGYKLFTLWPGSSAAGAPDGPFTLENAFVRAELDPATGWLKSLTHLASGADPLAGASGPHTQISQDPTDTWGHRVVSYAGAGVPFGADRVIWRERGPVRQRLRVESSWNHSTLVEEFILNAWDAAVEVRVTLDWHEPAHLLKLRFPAALSGPAATQEVPFGFLTRPVDGAEVPGQSWVDLTGTDAAGRPAGLTVVNNAKHGYDFSPAAEGRSPSIGLTALRSPVYSWHDPRTLDPDGLYSYQDQGLHHFSYLLLPHAGDWRAVKPAQRAAELGLTPRAQLESFHDGDLAPSGAYLDVQGEGVMVTAVKAAEDGVAGDVIVRLVETDGRDTAAQVRLRWLGRGFEASFGPQQIRTFRVPADPDQPIAEADLAEYPIGDRARGTWSELPEA